MSNDEKELSILINGTDRSTADVFTNDDIWANRLDKLFTPYKVQGSSRFYRIPSKDIVRVSRMQRAKS